MRVLHVDCNNFFVSCERIFRPDLEKKPVVVLSCNDGCVIARSPEAKALGIAMCQPYFQIRALERRAGLICFSANFELYADISNRIMQRIGQDVPSFEQYSIDECFFEIEEKAALPVARVIKKVVAKELSIPVTIGIGRTKSEAKVATHLAKKNEQFLGMKDLASTSQGERATLYQTMPLKALWGINTKTEATLNSHGIRTVFSFITTPSPLLKKWAGIPIERLALELQGIKCLELSPPKKHQQQLMYSRSFGEPLLHLDEMKEVVAAFSCRAAEKLRRLNLMTSVVTLIITGKENYLLSSESTSLALPQPSSCSLELTKASLSCLARLYKENKPYKKAGVLYSSLIPANSYPYSFWDNTKDLEKKNKLMTTLDSMRSRFGHKALFLAQEGIRSSWESRSTKRSPRYTTCWEELPIVFAK